MNNKEKLFYLLEEKVTFLSTSNLHTPEFEKQRYEIQSILFIIFNNLIQISEEIKKEIFTLFENHPNIYADIISVSENPNCSCRSRVSLYFLENNLDIKNLFTDFLNKHEEITDNFYVSILDNFKKLEENWKSRFKPQQSNYINPSNIVATKPPVQENNDLSGKIITIKNDQEYSNVIKSINSQYFIYKGFNIIEKDGQLKLYFY
jgi:hypothetical protein